MDGKSYYFPRLRWLNAKEIGIAKEYGISHEGDDFYLIHPHELAYVERGRITIYCSFDFSEFPFDSHTCDLNMGKFGIAIKMNPTNDSFSLSFLNPG